MLLFTLLLTAAFVWAAGSGVVSDASSETEYEGKLFDTSYVHTIDIIMEDWDGFLETCENEEYAQCSVVIDGETYADVAIRAKGNTSLSSVAAYGNDRYSFKVEFDHYDSGKNYYGLDKLNLNNCIQDTTYMKDFLCYQMMKDFGVSAPLASFISVSVNGEEWGLYLAVEGVEDSFLQRNYGSDHGELYKPDSMDFGGERENAPHTEAAAETDPAAQLPDENAFPQEAPENNPDESETGSAFPAERPDSGETASEPPGELPDGDESSSEPSGELPDEREFSGEIPGEMPDNSEPGAGMPGGMSGSDDVSLIYTDDEYDSYSNIFDNAKTEITDEDRDRLIESLKRLNEEEDIESVVDAESVIRYFVVHNFVCNFDSYTGSMIHNYYLYEEDGRLSMIPWDYNLAFGGFQSAADASEIVNYPIDTPVSGGTVDSRPMLAWIFSDEQYTELYHQYFREFLAEYFDSGYFEEMFDSVTEMIAPYVEDDPTAFYTYEEFQSGIRTLKEFCLLRAESAEGQLSGTIPSDGEGQNEDSSTFVDASGLDLSAMGDMSDTTGGGPGDFGIGGGPQGDAGISGPFDEGGVTSDAGTESGADPSGGGEQISGRRGKPDADAGT